PLCAAAAGDQAERDLGLTERRVVGADPDVAAHRELEAAAEAVPADRGDERRARRVHPVAELLDPARRAALAGGLAERRELLDVGPRDERLLAGAAQDDRADAVVPVERVELRLELLQQRRRERVHRRVVDRDERRGLAPLGRYEASHRLNLVLLGRDSGRETLSERGLPELADGGLRDLVDELEAVGEPELRELRREEVAQLVAARGGVLTDDDD